VFEQLQRKKSRRKQTNTLTAEPGPTSSPAPHHYYKRIVARLSFYSTTLQPSRVLQRFCFIGLFPGELDIITAEVTVRGEAENATAPAASPTPPVTQTATATGGTRRHSDCYANRAFRAATGKCIHTGRAQEYQRDVQWFNFKHRPVTAKRNGGQPDHVCHLPDAQ